MEGKQVMNTPSGGHTKVSLSAQGHLFRSMERWSMLIHSPSSKDSSLLPRQIKMNCSRRSSMNYAATLPLCLIHLSRSEKHVQLLMSSGFFLNMMSNLMVILAQQWDLQVTPRWQWRRTNFGIIIVISIIIRQPLCPVVGRRPLHAVSKSACLVLSSVISYRSSICPGRLSTLRDKRQNKQRL